MRLGDLVVRFVADMGQWNTGVKQAQKDMDDTAKSTEKLGGSAKVTSGDLLIMASAALAVGAAIVATEQKYGSIAKELKDLGYQTGATSDELQKLQYATVLSGENFGMVSQNLNKLTLSMGQAKDATSEQAKAFAALGINPEGKSSVQVFQEVALAMGKIEDKTKTAEIGMALYGRGYRSMIAFQNEYIENQKEINKYEGYSKDDLKTMEEKKIALDRLGNTFDLFVGKVVVGYEKVENANRKWGLDNLLSGLFNPKNGADRTSQNDIDKSNAAPATEDPNAGVLGQIQLRIDALKAVFGWGEKMVDSEKEYLKVAKEINAVKQAEKELQSDYLYNMQNAGRDVAGARQLTMGFNRSMSKLKGQETTLGGDLQNAAFKTIAAQQMNSDAYNTYAMNIENVNLSKDYPLAAYMADFEKLQSIKRKQAGVRTAT